MTGMHIPGIGTLTIECAPVESEYRGYMRSFPGFLSCYLDGKPVTEDRAKELLALLAEAGDE